MKVRHWSIIAILVLLSYLVYSQLIVLIMESKKPTPTPTRTPMPTFTPIFTPGIIPRPPTPTPTATLVMPPTDTPTPEGEPTSAALSPAVTATPYPPTVTAQPASPTATPPTATEVSPTATPAPTTPPPTHYQYRLGRPVTCTPNCGSTGVKGFVYDVTANYASGLIVKVWADEWCCGEKETGHAPYEILLSPGPRAGHWYVAVYSHDGSAQLSDLIEIETDGWESCESSGCQWAEVDFVARW